ncbi:MAG TPA: hypothetical protein VG650_02435 [Mycobacteriales bacterium]|nr:hypothetical protein [Mycobacteriales bacterium]
MVLQRLTPIRLPASAVVATACLLVLAGCGGKSAAEKAREAAVQAKAACDVFVNLHPPTGTDATSQIDYAKATYGAFLEAADHAGKAADLDARWKQLQSAADREAAAFQVIVRAAQGSTQLDALPVNRAVRATKTARPLFIGQCATADPTHFSPVSPSPSASPSPSRAKK